MKIENSIVFPSLFVAAFLAVFCQAAKIEEPPKNSYGMQGDSINLTCTVTGDVSSDPFEWWSFVSATPGGERIFSDPEMKPIDSTVYAIYGRYDLNIKSLNWETNGGQYGCRVMSEGNNHIAHVFVFQPLVLTANRMLAGQKYQLYCVSSFGAMDDLQNSDLSVPNMKIEVRGNEVINAKYELTPKALPNPYILNGIANYTADKYDDGQEFRCTVTIQEPYAQITNFITLDIQFGVEQPQFFPYNALYYVGEYINCTALGNPDPSYQWKSIESPLGSDVTFPQSQLEITSEMMGGINTWECTATNLLNGQTYTESNTITFDVEYNPDDTSPVTSSGVEAWKIAVGICVPLAIIAIAVGIYFGIKYHRKKKGASDDVVKTPAPDIGSGGIPNQAISEDEKVNGKPVSTDAARLPVSMRPNPLPAPPVGRTKDSPGYADLGVKQISGSYPGMNVSMSSSMDSFDDGDVNPNPAGDRRPPTGRQPAPGMQQPPRQPSPGRVPPGQPQPNRYVNASFVNESPSAGQPPDHPNTFV